MSKSYRFRVQSHVLRLLGDELIGHDRLAVFELVKNSYDADATIVNVTLDLDEQHRRIVVEDNGIGMSEETIAGVWLEIGTDSKRAAAARGRTRLGRFPLGEKGVGRLAIQKLGDQLNLITKTPRGPELELSIVWSELIGSARYLGDTKTINIRERASPKIFKTGPGTRITITQLHRDDWSRREIRDLYRLVSSLNNPFDEALSFQVNLHVPGRESDISDLPSLKEMLDASVWKFSFSLSEKGLLDWTYEFTPPRFKGLKPNKRHATEKLPLLDQDPEDLLRHSSGGVRRGDHLVVRSEDLVGIGPIKGMVYAFHRREEILRASGAPRQLKKWLDSQTGVRVYRDNIRVFNYGEPGEDWLGLDARRINRPAGKLGTQSVIAQISLDLAKSRSLKEKTNREGFDDNDSFRRLQRIVLSIFDLLQREHSEDRAAIDQAIKGEESVPAIDVALERLQSLGQRHKIEDQVRPILRSIKDELKTFQEIMVSSGLAGMNLALIFHEIVHGIDRIQARLRTGVDVAEIRREVNHLRKLLDTFKPLLQRDPRRKVDVGDLVERATDMHQDRFERHGIVLSNWTKDFAKKQDFTVTIPRGLMVAALSNVIDNAIYWVRFRRERDERTTPGAILALSYWDDDLGGSIAIVDNGPGVRLPREKIGAPFATTRPGGMGLGLFYCKTVMDMIGGAFDLVDAADLRDVVAIPKAYDGVAAVFSFRKE